MNYTHAGIKSHTLELIWVTCLRVSKAHRMYDAQWHCQRVRNRDDVGCISIAKGNQYTNVKKNNNTLCRSFHMPCHTRTVTQLHAYAGSSLTQTHTVGDGGRHTHTHRHTQRDTHRETHTHTDTHTERQRKRQRETQTGTQTQRQRHREKETTTTTDTDASRPTATTSLCTRLANSAIPGERDRGGGAAAKGHRGGGERGGME